MADNKPVELWSWNQEQIDALSLKIENLILLVQNWGGSNLPFHLKDLMQRLENIKLKMELKHKYFPEQLMERYNFLLSLIKSN